MARRSSRNVNSSYGSVSRVSDPPFVKLRPRVVLPYSRPSFLQTIEDRRTWHPGVLRPAATFSRRDQRRLVERSRNSFETFPSLHLGFAQPKKVAICVRRKTRREVIHALRKAGAGAAQKRRKRNEYSDVRC